MELLRIDQNLCIACQRNDPDLGKLWGSGKECHTLVGNLKTMWDMENEKVNINCSQNSFIQSNNGSPDFKTTFERHSAVFHDRYTGKYSKLKVDQLKKQQKKNKKCAVLLFCFEQSSRSRMQVATKDAANTQQNAKLTERWKDMEIQTNNSSLLAKLATGSLASHKLFYHLDCYLLMSQNYQQITEGKDQHHKEHWINATCFESIITFTTNEKVNQKVLSFVV